MTIPVVAAAAARLARPHLGAHADGASTMHDPAHGQTGGESGRDALSMRCNLPNPLGRCTMLAVDPTKIRPDHLDRPALIYVRQSTLFQVRENTASTARQYDLTQRARDLGWAREQIVVIDQDQGHSAPQLSAAMASNS